MPQTTPKRSTVPLLLLSWLVPGLGLVLLGRDTRKRGLILIALLHLTLFIGLLSDGGLIWPVWQPGTVGFNIVTNITFILQLGAGWMAILSWIATSIGIPFLSATDNSIYFELGSFYFLAAGSLNFFVIWQTLDRNRIEPFERLAD